MDTEIANEALRLFKKQGFEFQLGVRVTGATKKGKTCTVTIDGKPAGATPLAKIVTFSRDDKNSPWKPVQVSVTKAD